MWESEPNKDGVFKEIFRVLKQTAISASPTHHIGRRPAREPSLRTVLILPDHASRYSGKKSVKLEVTLDDHEIRLRQGYDSRHAKQTFKAPAA